jgi:hypothetical protein
MTDTLIENLLLALGIATFAVVGTICIVGGMVWLTIVENRFSDDAGCCDTIAGYM